MCDGPQRDPHLLWAQEEVLIGSLLVAEHTGWKWAKDWFIKMYNYVHD